MAKKMNGLGKGLGALLDMEIINNNEENKTENALEVDITLLDINAGQPRKQFDEEKLAELTESIRQHGVIQPIIVKKTGERYMIIAGERRFRASLAAGLKTVPVILKDIDEDSILEISLIENIQRADLNPVEEAKAIKELIEKYGYTQEECAARLSKSRSAIANSMRLLNLDDTMLDSLIKGELTAGHARALLMIDDEAKRLSAFNRIIAENLSVRDAEALAKTLNEASPEKPVKKRASLSADMLSAEKKLSEILDAKVHFKGNEQKGKLYIEYGSVEQLQRIYELLISI